MDYWQQYRDRWRIFSLMETEIKNIKVAAISTTVQNKIRKAKDLFKNKILNLSDA